MPSLRLRLAAELQCLVTEDTTYQLSIRNKADPPISSNTHVGLWITPIRLNFDEICSLLRPLHAINWLLWGG